MDLSKYTELFLAETREHLGTVNRLLLSLEGQPDDREAVDELFRAVHTVKGMAATMGYETTTALAHALEHLLDKVRAGAVLVDAAVVDLLLEGADAVERAAEEEAARGLGPSTAGAATMEGAAGSPGAPAWAALAAGPRRVTVSIVRTSPAPAARALLVLKRARSLGSVDDVAPDEAGVASTHFDGTLAFTLSSDQSDEALVAALSSMGDVETVLVEGPTLPEAPSEAQDDPDASADPTAARPVGGVEGGIVRIRQERLDAVLNHLGELVIARDRLGGTAARIARADLAEVVEEVSRLVGDIQDEIMKLRMVPVGEVFERFPRLVRDAARSLAKQVELEVQGRDQELDRAMLNELGDVLVHLLRNAVDHGIEAPAERAALGKRESGRVRLSAHRDRATLVVQVTDDGRGIQRERVLRTAVERGLLQGGQGGTLSDDEIFELLTRPGFTTAERVTDVSGRGVGLDTVQSRLQRLGGTLSVTSEEGKGTVCTIRLPLTLAIIRSLLVEVRGVVYAVPIGTVVEVMEVGPQPDGWGARVDSRGESIPLLDLARLLHPGHARPRDAVPVVVAEVSGTRFAFSVDALIGQQEAVLKRFDAVAQMVNVFSGATLLADGLPALVLDPAKLVPHLRGTLAADAA